MERTPEASGDPGALSDSITDAALGSQLGLTFDGNGNSGVLHSFVKSGRV